MFKNLSHKVVFLRKDLNKVLTTLVICNSKEAAINWVKGAYGEDNVEIISAE